ncbi:something about silencing protein 10, partial [Lampetra fluviatilis]
MPLENESDDDEDGDDDGDMESDLDKKDKDDEDLPDERAWGARKRVFYDTEYPDDDRRVRPKTDEVCAEDEEEEAALAVQKRLAQSISDDDLGLDLLQ